MGAWTYTSWYWYTCNIKWFCEENQSTITSPKNDKVNTSESKTLSTTTQEASSDDSNQTDNVSPDNWDAKKSPETLW